MKSFLSLHCIPGEFDGSTEKHFIMAACNLTMGTPIHTVTNANLPVTGPVHGLVERNYIGALLQDYSFM